LSPSTYTGFLTSAKTIDKISLHLTVGFDDAGFAWSVVIKRAATARLPKKATYANVRFLRVIRGQMCDPRSWHWKQRSCGNVAFVPACPRYSMVFIMPMPPCDATPSYPPPPKPCHHNHNYHPDWVRSCIAPAAGDGYTETVRPVNALAAHSGARVGVGSVR